MPFDWKRITMAEKQQIIDSVKKSEAIASQKFHTSACSFVFPPSCRRC